MTATRTVSGEVARREETKPTTVVQMIQKLKPELERALPRHLDGGRMVRLALTVVRQSELAAQKAGKPNQSLLQCTPDSFAGSLLTAAAVGVEVGTPEAYLVPYKGECTLIIGYQGYTKLFWQSPNAQSLNAQAVYERDEFEYAYGLTPKLHHVPAKGDRGKVIFYYAAVSLSTGGQHFEVLTPDEVKELRGGKVGGNAGIADPMRWMERKTAIRQVLKPMPKSSQLSMAVESDEREGSGLYVERLAENAPVAIGAAAPEGVDTTTGEVIDQNGPTEEEIARINAEANADARNGGSK